MRKSRHNNQIEGDRESRRHYNDLQPVSAKQQVSRQNLHFTKSVAKFPEVSNRTVLDIQLPLSGISH